MLLFFWAKIDASEKVLFFIPFFNENLFNVLLDHAFRQPTDLYVYRAPNILLLFVRGALLEG